MYQQILKIVLLIILSQKCFSAETKSADLQKEITQIYKAYDVKKNNFFKTTFKKENLKSNYNQFSQELKTEFEKIINLEKKSKTVLLTEEASQLALDIEMLETIKTLSQSKIDKTACEAAIHENNLNRQSEKDRDALEIDKIINQVCKN